ncbi:MAG: enoyl-CoA hydratase/isomerase family protein [Bacteroidetes bacterium]|nr:enoyl-CoA hydratase/isomerase family protein [Bacteroidota bacterium]
MDKTKLGSVDIVVEKKIATITFFHPAHNSLPGHLLTALEKAITNASERKDINVIIVKSGGERTFCAGASFDELSSIKDFEEGKRFFMGFARVINACRMCPKLIIGRVQGKAVGGGVGLAAAMDYCMATKYASIKLSELGIGIGPFVISPAVERKIGLSAMSQLAINATEWKTAEWAKQKGLFAEVYPTTEQLDNYLIEFSSRLASFSLDAMMELKKMIWQDTGHWDTLLKERAAVSGRLALSDFTKNAITNFKKKP